MAQDLRTFLDQVKEAFPQDFVEVTKEVDLHYESTALVEKLEKENRFPVLMFKNFKGHTMPVVVNLAASYQRLALALGTDEQHMVQRYAELGDKTQPLKWVDRSEAPVKEVIYTEDEVDLSAVGPLAEGISDPVPVIGQDDVLNDLSVYLGRHLLYQGTTGILTLAPGPQIAAGNYAYLEHICATPFGLMIARPLSG